MTEVELCEHIVNYYQEYETYKEVWGPGGRCDIVVKNNAMLIAIEAKLTFNLKVVVQGWSQRPYANFCYIALPKEKARDSEACKLCKSLNVGIMTVCENGKIEVKQPSPFFRRVAGFHLEEKQKFAIAGAQHNNMSEFKIAVRQIERMVKDKGGRIPVNVLFEKEKYHYESCKHARKSFLSYVRQGILKQFEYKKGIIILKDPTLVSTGRQEDIDLFSNQTIIT